MALALVATPALADFFVAGDLNVAWSPNDPNYVMTDMGGWFQKALTGETPGVHEFKVTDGTWDNTWPNQNAKTDFGADGALAVNFYPGTHDDGWFPKFNRVGYEGQEAFNWEVMGSFNGWASPFALLTPIGGGVYRGSAVVATAGNYEFKFRKEGDWNIAIGYDFSNYENNISWTTTTDNEELVFSLDLPNGRWTIVPEPASLLGLAVLGLVVRRR
jgi:hypothetical protein